MSKRASSCNSYYLKKFANTGHFAIKAILESIGNKYLISQDPKDYVFAAVRANSIGLPNGNGDAFPRESLVAWNKLESKPTYRTYEFKPHHVNHKTSEPKMARGVVLDSHLNEDNPDDGFVEILLAVDMTKDPILARGIADGTLNEFSMGCNAMRTVCSVCDHEAYAPAEYCNHIRSGKMKFFKSASGESIQAFEKCYDVTFQEISSVDDAADKTALTQEVIEPEEMDKLHAESSVLNLSARLKRIENTLDKGEESMAKAAAKQAQEIKPENPKPENKGEKASIPEPTVEKPGADAVKVEFEAAQKSAQEVTPENPKPENKSEKASIPEPVIEQPSGETASDVAGKLAQADIEQESDKQESEDAEVSSVEELGIKAKMPEELEEKKEEKEAQMPEELKEKMEEKEAAPMPEELKEKMEEKACEAQAEEKPAEEKEAKEEPAAEEKKEEPAKEAKLYPFAKVYKDVTAQKLLSGEIQVKRAGMTVFTIPAKDKTANQSLALADVLKMVCQNGLVATAHKLGGTINKAAIQKKADGGVQEYSKADMAGGREKPRESVLDDANMDQKDGRAAEHDSVSAEGDSSDKKDKPEVKTLANSDVREDAIADTASSREKSPESAVASENSDGREHHDARDIKYDVTKDRAVDMALEGIDPKKAKAIRIRIAQLVEDLKKESVEDGEDKAKEEMEKRMEEHKEAFQKRFTRAVRLAARRYALNLEPCELKYNFGEILAGHDPSSGFIGIDDPELIMSVVDNAFLKGGALDKTVAQMVERAGEFMTMHPEAFKAIEADTNRLMPVNVSAAEECDEEDMKEAAEECDEEEMEGKEALRKQASRGSVILRSSVVERSAADETREKIRAAVNGKTARTRLFGI